VVLKCASNPMGLRELVEKYLALAGDFGRPALLEAFGIPHAEAESLWSAMDEDYHISRFLHFSLEDGLRFSISGFPQTHLAMDVEIESLL
jgi:hypothetical protein